MRRQTSWLMMGALVCALTGCEGKLDAGSSPVDRVGPGGSGADMRGVDPDMARASGDQGQVTGGKDAGGQTGADMPIDAPDMPAALPADPGLKRLTDTQYRNTLTSVLRQLDQGIQEPDWPTQVVLRSLNSSPALDSRLDGVPPFGVYTRVAIAASNHLVGRREFRDQILGVPEAERPAALEAWLREQGHVFFRRPMSEDELGYYTREIATGVIDQKALREVLTALFLSPHFLFHIEHGMAQAPDLQRVSLTQWEVASRLSYFLWRDAPDAELYALARGGTLTQPEVLRAQATRLLRDERSDDFLRMFAVRWLGINLDRLDYGSIVQFDRFKITFNGENSGWEQSQYNDFFNEKDARPALRDAMVEDMTAYMRHVIVTREGGLRDLFTTTVATSTDPRISEFYGVPTWDGVGQPPEHDAERGGVLGRVLALGDAAENTHPILRGLHIREHMLCRKMAPPPMDFIFRSPPSPPFSTRDMVDFTTGPANVGCWGCHQMTNGIGFALDGYDVFGRKRDVEYYFRSRQEREAIARADDTIARWEDVPQGAEVVVDAVSAPRLDLLDGDTTTRTPAELARLIIDWTPDPAVDGDGQPILDVYQCFARHLEEVGYDGALVTEPDRDALVAQVRQGTILEAITTLVTSPSFAIRDFGDELTGTQQEKP